MSDRSNWNPQPGGKWEQSHKPFRKLDLKYKPADPCVLPPQKEEAKPDTNTEKLPDAKDPDDRKK